MYLPASQQDYKLDKNNKQPHQTSCISTLKVQHDDDKTKILRMASKNIKIGGSFPMLQGTCSSSWGAPSTLPMFSRRENLVWDVFLHPLLFQETRSNARCIVPKKWGVFPFCEGQWGTSLQKGDAITTQHDFLQRLQKKLKKTQKKTQKQKSKP